MSIWTPSTHLAFKRQTAIQNETQRILQPIADKLKTILQAKSVSFDISDRNILNIKINYDIEYSRMYIRFDMTTHKFYYIVDINKDKAYNEQIEEFINKNIESIIEKILAAPELSELAAGATAGAGAGAAPSAGAAAGAGGSIAPSAAIVPATSALKFEPEYLKDYKIKCPGCGVVQDGSNTPFKHNVGCPYFGQEANYDFSKSLAASKGDERKAAEALRPKFKPEYLKDSKIKCPICGATQYVSLRPFIHNPGCEIGDQQPGPTDWAAMAAAQKGGRRRSRRRLNRRRRRHTRR